MIVSIKEKQKCFLKPFRSIIFFKSEFLGQNIGRSVISNFFQNILKKTKYWWRNSSFTFSLEVKVYLSIDSPMTCNQLIQLSWDYTDVKNWLLS